MNTLRPDETVLEGKWVLVGSRVEADAAEKRIEHLVVGHLSLLGLSQDGWSQLYKDPTDGRFWELSFPKSHMHGGGPMRLEVISVTTAGEKYSAVR